MSQMNIVLYFNNRGVGKYAWTTTTGTWLVYKIKSSTFLTPTPIQNSGSATTGRY